MAQFIDFAPGPKQSLPASLYFAHVGTDWRESALPSGAPRRILILMPGSETLLLRLWSSIPGLKGKQLAAFVPWLRGLLAEVKRMRHHPDHAQAVALASIWAEARPVKGDLFLEVLDPESGFDTVDADLSFGVVAEQVVLVSAPDLIFTKLAAGLFGLSVHSLGSWLVGADADAEQQQMA